MQQGVISFTISVNNEDWDKNFGGWRCPSLKIPGASIDAIFVNGVKVDEAKYQILINHFIIRWTDNNPPPQALVSITLTKELTTKELSTRWKKLAIVLPFFAAIATAFISHFPYQSIKVKPGSIRTDTSSVDSKITHKIKNVELRYSKQRDTIVHGPPGTSKTWSTKYNPNGKASYQAPENLAIMIPPASSCDGKWAAEYLKLSVVAPKGYLFKSTPSKDNIEWLSGAGGWNRGQTCAKSFYVVVDKPKEKLIYLLLGSTKTKCRLNLSAFKIDKSKTPIQFKSDDSKNTLFQIPKDCFTPYHSIKVDFESGESCIISPEKLREIASTTTNADGATVFLLNQTHQEILKKSAR
jgi:hypothetical protein